MPKAYASLYDRLVANTRETDNGCWVWSGALRNGRGSVSMRVPESDTPVHVNAGRLMLELRHGYHFPFDQVGHYRCFDPLCINPDHLRIETQAENLSTRRGYAPCKGRWLPVLFPTSERELAERIEDWLDLVL